MTPDGDRVYQFALEHLFADNPAAVYLLDVKGRVLRANDATWSRLGRSPEAVPPDRALPGAHPDDRDLIASEFAAATRGEMRRYRARGRRPDGSAFAADVVNIPILMEGSVSAVLAIATDIDDLHLAHADLDHARSLLQLASRVARLGVWSVDLRTGERYWGPEMFEILRFDPGDPPPRERMLALMDSSSRGRFNAALEAAQGEGVPLDETVVFEFPDGERLHARIVGQPVRSTDGEVVAINGSLSDITEQMLAEKQRDLVAERISRALDGISDSLIFVDDNWVVRFLNRRTASDLSLTPEEIYGRPIWDLRAFDPRLKLMLRRAMRDRSAFTHRGYDPELGRWLETRAFPTGDLLGIHVRDVTEVEAARDRLFDNARQIQAQSMLLDATSDGIVMRGLGGLVEFTNRSATQLLGRAADAIVGTPLDDLLGLSPAQSRSIEAALADSGRAAEELEVTGPDGTRRILDSRWQLVSGGQGAPEAVFCTLSDITERRERERILMRSQRMESIGTLAGGIAHDLNNVLTPLLLSTQLLASGETDPQRIRILTGMQQTIARGSDMIRQVLTFARGIEGQRTRVDIAELTDGFARFCRDTLPKNVTVTVTAEDELHVVGDFTQLLQVLMNLATNARDAMPDGGRIRLHARARDGRVLISVSDDGAGMDAETLARVFEPFYTNKAVGRGTGLGLAISQAIATSHGGSLDAVSTPGEGTEFTLDLPRDETPSTPETAPLDSPAAPIELDGLRVLILDDEDDIVDAAAIAIAAAGGMPLGAHGSEEAMALLEQEDVDVVLTDLVLPGITGRGFVEWLSRNRPTVPVVTMSGIPEQGERAAARPNVVATLDKPFSIELLLSTVRAAAARTPRDAS